MAITQKLRTALRTSLASLSASKEVETILAAGVGGQALSATDSPTFAAVATTGNATVGGVLGVTGVANLHNTAITGTLSTSAAATLASGVITAGLTVGTTLGVTGVATFSDDVHIASGKVLKINSVQVVGAQQAAVVPVAVTFNATAPSTYASPTGALTISAGATPTAAELLAYCDELRANVVALQAVLHAHGLTS